MTDLDVILDLDQARIDRFNPAAVEDLFRELEFRTLTRQLNALVNKMHPVMAEGEQMDLFGKDEPEALPVEEQSADQIKSIIVNTPESLAGWWKRSNRPR